MLNVVILSVIMLVVIALNDFMPSGIMLSVFVLGVIILNVDMLSDVMLIVLTSEIRDRNSFSGSSKREDRHWTNCHSPKCHSTKTDDSNI